jgi:hypothetical protein
MQLLSGRQEMLTKFLWGQLSIHLHLGDVGNNIKIYFRGIALCCKDSGRSGKGTYYWTVMILYKGC